jgi:hypothetical protein
MKLIETSLPPSIETHCCGNNIPITVI